MASVISREVRLRQWPSGIPSDDDFQIVETEVSAPSKGEVLVRNLFMSVDPYMRGRLRPGPSYAASFQIGAPLNGGCVGIVERSHNPELPEGTHVLSGMGFREAFVSDGSNLKTINPGVLSPSVFLGVMGMPGQTAYVGLLEIGAAKSGETVYVSAAAGAVGSAVCQIARIKGLTVVASAGTPEKVEWLKSEARVPQSFNYRETSDLSAELRRQCPDGIDVYFDNVGGTTLEAALGNMNDFGRVAACGMISRYNDTAPHPGPTNLTLIVSRRLRIQGFIVSDHSELTSRFEAEMREWISSGEVRWRETMVDGIDHAVGALAGLFTGSNTGKMVVRL